MVGDGQDAQGRLSRSEGVRLAAAVLLVAAIAPGWIRAQADGVSLQRPRAWHATARPLTPVVYPAQVLAVASFPFPRDPRPNGCSPEGTLARMQPDGALLYVIEYDGGGVRHADFPPRPRRLRLVHFARYECFGPSYRVTFRESGRFFQVQVAFGRDAGAAVHATALRVLNSFHAEPR